MPRQYASESLTIAVASNFHVPLIELIKIFNSSRSIQENITVISASTGQLYKKIMEGERVDIFLSADDIYTELLIRYNLAQSLNRFTYAEGKLVLWSPKKPDDEQIHEFLMGDSKPVVIPNPEFAPYGRAAESFLKRIGFLPTHSDRVIYAENARDAFDMIKTSGKGFTSLSLLHQNGCLISEVKKGDVCIIPSEFHPPILQQAVLLNKAEHNKLALSFMEYLRSPQAQTLITNFGYSLPDQSASSVFRVVSSTSAQIIPIEVPSIQESANDERKLRP